MIDIAACPTRLPGVPVPMVHIVEHVPPPNQDLCRDLARALDDAKSGELRSAAIVAVYTKRRTAKGRYAECYGDGVLLVGKLEEVKRSLLEWMETQ